MEERACALPVYRWCLITCVSIGVVVSPLNALMHDEVTKFCSLGMTAVQVGTECSPTVTERVTSGGVQLVFMSSETI